MWTKEYGAKDGMAGGPMLTANPGEYAVSIEVAEYDR